MTYHEPVLLAESINGLNVRPGGIYVDVTYGSGGHSRAILERLTGGKLVAFDQDEEAEKNKTDDKRLIFVRHNFRFMTNFLRYYGINEVDGVLADMGVSWHQFDTAKRGFSFRLESELDMRMNQNARKTAKIILNTYDEKELTRLFVVYGELQNAGRLAFLISGARSKEEITHTGRFLSIIKPCVPRHGEHKYLAQVFQALRIEVNDELRNLKELLKQSVQVLKPGGRLVVITYHSLEDRLVKNFMKSGNFEGKAEKDFFGNIRVPFKQVNKNVIVPTGEEIARNNRARSAKLRIAERLEISSPNPASKGKGIKQSKGFISKYIF
jgi:16S rRNA (cytosine1402-N4)-methyltransferase